MSAKRHYSPARPKTCPACGEKTVAKILFGMPALSDNLIKELDEGKTVLGGCMIETDSPTWQCTKCNTEIYKRKNKIKSNI
jgi:ribosomal protein L37AE/L43A